jgi:four helix bundle protein
MEAAKSIQDLIVWRKPHDFVMGVYAAALSFPEKELYELASQFHRTVVSISANITDEFRKYTNADKVRFLKISKGALEECRYYPILSHDLNYPNKTKLCELIDDIRKLLNAYRRAILTPTSQIRGSK